VQQELKTFISELEARFQGAQTKNYKFLRRSKTPPILKSQSMQQFSQQRTSMLTTKIDKSDKTRQLSKFLLTLLKVPVKQQSKSGSREKKSHSRERPSQLLVTSTSCKSQTGPLKLLKTQQRGRGSTFSNLKKILQSTEDDHTKFES
jgi:hypothetical protein